jgi:hypothetical protein
MIVQVGLWSVETEGRTSDRRDSRGYLGPMTPQHGMSPSPAGRVAIALEMWISQSCLDILLLSYGISEHSRFAR